MESLNENMWGNHFLHLRGWGDVAEKIIVLNQKVSSKEWNKNIRTSKMYEIWIITDFSNFKFIVFNF